MKFILASASPRRKELLEQMNLQFEIIPAQGEEEMHFSLPHEVVMDLSRQKAEEIAKKRKLTSAIEIIIGADTVVACDGQIMGKPKDEADAHRMLAALQGRSHKVYTGVTLIIQNNEKTNVHSFYDETEVYMYPMSDKEINYYVDTKEPMDKAGGYGIQGKCAVFIEKIHGDYNNVVGLPIAKIYQELLKQGIDIYAKS